MRRDEKESNLTTVGCDLTRPLTYRSRTQSFFVGGGKKREVTVLSAWRVVQGPTGFLN